MPLDSAAGRLTAVLGPTNTGKTYLAIERMLGVLSRTAEGEPVLLLSGGSAAALSPCLNRPHRVVDNLPLQGLRIVAQQEGWL